MEHEGVAIQGPREIEERMRSIREALGSLRRSCTLGDSIHVTSDGAEPAAGATLPDAFEVVYDVAYSNDRLPPGHLSAADDRSAALDVPSTDIDTVGQDAPSASNQQFYTEPDTDRETIEEQPSSQVAPVAFSDLSLEQVLAGARQRPPRLARGLVQDFEPRPVGAQLHELPFQAPSPSTRPLQEIPNRRPTGSEDSVFDGSLGDLLPRRQEAAGRRLPPPGHVTFDPGPSRRVQGATIEDFGGSLGDILHPQREATGRKPPPVNGGGPSIPTSRQTGPGTGRRARNVTAADFGGGLGDILQSSPNQPGNGPNVHLEHPQVVQSSVANGPDGSEWGDFGGSLGEVLQAQRGSHHQERQHFPRATINDVNAGGGARGRRERVTSAEFGGTLEQMLPSHGPSHGRHGDANSHTNSGAGRRRAMSDDPNRREQPRSGGRQPISSGNRGFQGGLEEAMPPARDHQRRPPRPSYMVDLPPVLDDKAVLNMLQKFIYTPPVGDAARSKQTKSPIPRVAGVAARSKCAKLNKHNMTECPICLDDFQERQVLRHVDCGHLFHEKCATMWFKVDHTRCPLCRYDVIKKAWT
ncbi:hypothetical protein CYMTET_32846 [Cymbomonas tetramitiformis]|uniref:RING-type domain-containing protein n=1 Tax=Cymbomonas tetramitiformis TaxID=36881 RepID=A0AAE0FEW1_9CHLO|nr:hypothetical protein CYMTET_32846 [Cymbomonas tetramitiformis]